MTVFIDTSAFFAVLDRDDANHLKATKQWSEILGRDRIMVTTNYVLVETFALLQHRLGLQAVRTFQEDVMPLVTVEWVGEETQDTALPSWADSQSSHLQVRACMEAENVGYGARK
jgi:predicted nucleic acid-binding protein